eukprot:COSAG02_NODE_8820_length_2432_cov_5.941706_2_plen_191_part_00
MLPGTEVCYSSECISKHESIASRILLQCKDRIIRVGLCYDSMQPIGTGGEVAGSQTSDVDLKAHPRLHTRWNLHLQHDTAVLDLQHTPRADARRTYHRQKLLKLLLHGPGQARRIMVHLRSGSYSFLFRGLPGSYLFLFRGLPAQTMMLSSGVLGPFSALIPRAVDRCEAVVELIGRCAPLVYVCYLLDV